MIQTKTKRVSITWSEPEMQFLRIKYTGTKQNILDIQQGLKEQFNTIRTPHAISKKASDLGITNRIHRKWKQPSMDYIYENVGLISVSDMAKHLKRTETAVQCKCNRMSVETGRTNRHGWYNITDISKIFGCYEEKVKYWISKGLLKCEEFNNLSKYKIVTKELKKFICSYPLELTGRNLDMVQIIEILCGDNS